MHKQADLISKQANSAQQQQKEDWGKSLDITDLGVFVHYSKTVWPRGSTGADSRRTSSHVF